MKVVRQLADRRFLDEAARFALRSTCGDCLYALADGGCAHEWPNEDHARLPEREQGEVVFCKEFELR